MNPGSAIGAVVFVVVLSEGLIDARSAGVPSMQTAANIAIDPNDADLWAWPAKNDFHDDTGNARFAVTGYDGQYEKNRGGDPVLVEDHFMETTLGNPDGVDVSVVDATGFVPGAHGQRITDVFLANTSHASLLQRGGWGSYLLNDVTLSGTNAVGYIRHALKHDAGIFWTATDQSPLYSQATAGAWSVENNRAFHIVAKEFANWMSHQNTLFISSLENATVAGSGLPGVPLYCDDFDSEASPGWIPLCGALDDYIAHSGVGVANTIFVGAIDTRRMNDLASGAIRADGVFAPHTIYVESPDGSTSQATPVLAAYATNLAFSNPSWDAARLKQELMKLAREEVIRYFTGATNSQGNIVPERRTIRAIRPAFAPKAISPAVPPTVFQDTLDFPHFANGTSITSDFVLVNIAPHPIRPVLYFFDQGGDRIAAESVVKVTGDLEVTEDGALTVQMEMEPLGELTISTSGRGETVSGSARVVSNGSIGGVLRFDISGIGVAGVGAGQTVRDALFPARRQVGGIRTAAAIRNLETEAMVVTCRLMKGGSVLEEKDLSLEANGQDARFIEEVFTATDTSNFRGSVRCTAEGRFTGVAIEMDAGNRILTTLPVVPVESGR